MDDNEEMVVPIDLSNVLIGYEGKWVILSDDKKRVIASGNALADIAARIQEGLVMRVPRFDSAYTPAALPDDSSVQ